MIVSRWIACVGIAALSVASGFTGCSKPSAPAKAPPGVTKDMEQTKPPAVDMGKPSGDQSGSLPAPGPKNK